MALEEDRIEEYMALAQQLVEGRYDGDGPEDVAEPKEADGDGEHRE